MLSRSFASRSQQFRLFRQSPVQHAPLLQPFTDFCHHRVFVGKLAGLQLRVDQLVVDCQLETAATGGFQFQTLKFLFELSQHFGRQTDGLGLVVSSRAVPQVDLHQRLLVLKQDESD